jgi:RHS repeat-associated protein
VVARYSHSLNVDEPLAMLRSSAVSYYDADGLGSVTSLSSSAGSVVQTYGYDSLGKQTSSSGSLTNPFQYTAREFDPETNLYYYRARYYDPSVGRFLSEDPIRFSGGQNFYLYVRNHSTDLIDPSGLLQVCCRSAHLGPVGWYANAILRPPPCHCFLKLSNGDTLGGYHNGTWHGPMSGSLGGLDLRRNDGTDHDKYAAEAQCTDVPGSSCENDSKAKKAFGGNRPLPGGYGFGEGDYGTSNDAAAGLLKDAGIGSTLPACAWGKHTGFPLPKVGSGSGLLFGPQ